MADKIPPAGPPADRPPEQAKTKVRIELTEKEFDHTAQNLIVGGAWKGKNDSDPSADPSNDTQTKPQDALSYEANKTEQQMKSDRQSVKAEAEQEISESESGE